MPSVKTDNVIRIGDSVSVTNPEVFVRCGYPWDVEYVVRNFMTEDTKNKIIDLLNSVGIINRSEIFWTMKSDPKFDKSFDRVATELAYGILRKESFGGNERKIYTKTVDALKNDSRFTVVDRKVVKTGQREMQVDGDDWHTYHYHTLENQKSHVIYQLEYQPSYLDYSDTLQTVKTLETIIALEDNRFWIEKKNITKL